MEVEKYRLIYKINNNKKNIRILGKDFVKNNKNKGKLIFLNRKYPLEDIFTIKTGKENIFKLGIMLNQTVTNRSSMFKGCKTLMEISGIEDGYFNDDIYQIIGETENLFRNDETSELEYSTYSEIFMHN